MRKTAIVLVLAAAGSALALGPDAPAAPTRPPMVLLSIDGLRPRDVLEAAQRGLRVPHLRRLVAEGAHASGVVGVLPTVTYPSHVTLVTGVFPARHGILANQPFDPMARNMGGWYWYAEDIRVPTLWDAAANAGLTTANVAWPATVGARITYNIPQYWRASTADDEKLTRAVSTPGVLTDAERAIGPFPSGESGSLDDDRRRAAFCSYLVETRRPQLSFCYLTALDAVQHTYGPGSPEADAALEAIDVFVGSVRAAAKKAGAGEATLAVVSDHGFVRVERELQLNAALRQAGLIRSDGKGNVVAWSAFAWSAGGTAAVYLREPGDADARSRTAHVLQRLAADPASGVERVLGRAEALAAGGFSDAEFVVAARPGCHLGAKLEGSVMQLGGGGAHGLLAAHREMDAAFFVAGPGVPAGLELGRVDMRDVAPTLAALLNVSLPAAEGHSLLRGRGVAGRP